jgi:hypothetical protein
MQRRQQQRNGVQRCKTVGGTLKACQCSTSCSSFRHYHLQPYNNNTHTPQPWMMQFLDYEKNNNRFIRAIQHDPALASLLPALITKRVCYPTRLSGSLCFAVCSAITHSFAFLHQLQTQLLVPQDVALEGRTVDLTFAQHHIVITEHPAAASPLHFVSLSGMRGTFLQNSNPNAIANTTQPNASATTTVRRKRDALCVLTGPPSNLALFDPTTLFAQYVLRTHRE